MAYDDTTQRFVVSIAKYIVEKRKIKKGEFRVKDFNELRKYFTERYNELYDDYVTKDLELKDKDFETDPAGYASIQHNQHVIDGRLKELRNVFKVLNDPISDDVL